MRRAVFRETENRPLFTSRAYDRRMYVVALTRWHAAVTIEHELPELARALELAPYDARLKLVAPAPAILRTNLASEPAHELVAILRKRFHGAVTCDVRIVPMPARAIAARGVELGADHLIVTYELERRARVDYSDVLGVVRAAELRSESQRTETVEKKFDMKGAVLTGGLKLTKNVSKVQTSGSSEREPVAYVFRTSDPEPLLLKENELSYEGLGALRGTTAHQSFEALIACLRRNSPSALHDDRLLMNKRRADAPVVRGNLADRSISMTNISANDLAAHLLMLAHLERQL